MNSSPIKTAIIQRRLPHYRLPIYNKLVEEHPEIKLTLFCGQQENISGGSGIAIQKDPDFVCRVKNYRLSLFGREILFQPYSFKAISSKKFDVVIFEGSLILISSIFILFLRKLTGRKNIIWIKGWPKSAGEIFLVKFFKKIFLMMADHFIGYGKTSINLLGRYSIITNKITVAQNTVYLSNLLNAKDVYLNSKPDSELVSNILNNNYPFIFNIGRLTKSKRVLDIIKSFKILTGKPVNENLRLIIAGNGPELMNLKNFIKKENLVNVIFTGTISDKDADLLLLNCRCCVFPGAVGLSLNQAMAAGKPVICADEDGPDSELIIHYQNGLRYRKGDINQLMGYIELVLSDKQLADEFGIKAKETIKTSATIENMVNKIAEAINKTFNLN
jgi:glycosyltransferase involved in cell wall biosynthesis